MYQEPQKHMYCLLSGQELNEMLQALSVILKGLNDFARNEDSRQSQILKDKLMDGGQVMNILHITRGTLQSLRIKGILPYIQIVNKILNKSSDIEKLIESNYTCRRAKSPF